MCLFFEVRLQLWLSKKHQETMTDVRQGISKRSREENERQKLASLEERLYHMISDLHEIRVEMKTLKAQRRAIEAFLDNPNFCPDDVDRRTFERCRTVGVGELEEWRHTLAQDIRVKEQDIRDKEQDIRVKEQDIRNLNESTTHLSYAEALRRNVEAEMIFPPTASLVRYGRQFFDARLHSIFAAISARSTRMTKQDSCAVVLQCASGVGKTFACNTFRRGQLLLSPSVDYVPIGVYLGLNQGFDLTQDEKNAIREKPGDAIKSVLYQRLVFALSASLEEINRHREAPDRFAAALDGANGEWVQKFPFPAEVTTSIGALLSLMTRSAFRSCSPPSRTSRPSD